MKTILATSALFALLSAPAIAAGGKEATARDNLTRPAETTTKGVIVTEELTEI